MSFSPTLIWFLVGLALVLVEVAAPGVILVFFGLGAWIVALTTQVGLTGSLASQLLVFTIASVALLFTLRKWVRSRFLGHVSDEQNPAANLDEFAGQTVIVVREILPGSLEGKVEYKGAQWNAIAEETIAEGERAVITGVDGITLLVHAPSGEAEK